MHFKAHLLALFFSFSFLVLTSVESQGQRALALADSILSLDKKIFAVPYLTYTPETRWAVGISGFAFFKTVKNDSLLRPSSVRLNLAYTQLKQIIFWMPYDLFLRDNTIYLHGEVGFYRYPYFFNGIGNVDPIALEERYTASFPRFRLNAQYRITKRIYFGPRYWFQRLDMLATAEGGLLETQNIAGNQGGVNSGFGLLFTYDTRKQIFFPTNSLFVQLGNLHFAKAYGSDFDYNAYSADVRYYKGLMNNKHALAMQLYSELNFGDVPFNHLAQVGGTNVMRGYRKGWYRDKQMLALQAEYRSRLYWRVGYILGLSSAWVAAEPGKFQIEHTIPAAQIGLRWELNRAENLRFRIDYARGRNSDAFYVTVGEAF